MRGERVLFAVIRHELSWLGGIAVAGKHHPVLGLALLGAAIALSVADKFCHCSQGETDERTISDRRS